VLADPKFPGTERVVSEVRAAASATGQQLIVLDVSSDREIETAFTTLVQRGAGALLAGFGGFFSPNGNGLPRWRPDTGFPRSTSSAILSRPAV